MPKPKDAEETENLPITDEEDAAMEQAIADLAKADPGLFNPDKET